MQQSTETTTLVESIRARLDEDEQAAKDARSAAPGWFLERSEEDEDGPWPPNVHIARHDPARVLSEVEAKRQMVDELLAEPHFLDDREWYGCRAVTDGRDGEKVPTGRECTCGRDAMVERYLRLLALPYR